MLSLSKRGGPCIKFTAQIASAKTIGGKLKRLIKSLKEVRWTGTLIVATIALVIAGSLGGFYISDTLQGKGTTLGQMLKVVGFCPAPSGDLDGTGIVGPQGEKGDKGDTGETGAPGKDATVTPAPAPNTTAGPAGTKGSTGASGAPGTEGESGATGAPGATGATGATGETGATGATGATGETGAAGICTALDTASLAGDLIPAVDNTYSLGTLAARWKSLQLGPGTLWIQDTETGQQAGITISDGTMLIDGVDGLRVGNIRFTSTGITSLQPDQDITIGSVGDQGWMSVAHGIKFSDGTTMTSAAGTVGPQGPRGLTGATGPQGPQGPPGTIENNGFVETKACMYTGRPNNVTEGSVLIGTCGELGLEGKDILLLVKQ
ncbi:MAG: collagen-like protein [Rhodoluna sp.]|nr:collagen-like protein [Rhodoluna sp.]